MQSSAVWNLELYKLPTILEVSECASLPYRRCPHIAELPELPSPENGVHFCMLHLAYMCASCWKAHGCDMKLPQKQKGLEISEQEFMQLLSVVERGKRARSDRLIGKRN